MARGKSNGTETIWDNTLVTASDTLTLVSGNDTILRGAQLAGETVKLDVGGDLLIETLQDVTDYTSKQHSSGIDISVCIPPFCYGAPAATGSFNASNQEIKHNYQSAVGQSGIAAGDGGFQIDVKGDTTLIGAAITSTQAAIDEGKNSLTTASLSSVDLENIQKTNAFGSSTSLSYGSGTALSNIAQNITSNVLGNLNSEVGLPENREERSVTQSVISPANITITGTGDEEIDRQSAETVTLLSSRDPETANQSLENALTLQQAQLLEEDMQEARENQQAAALVGSVLSEVVGDIAQSQDWASDSPQKIALHGLVGLITAKIGDGNVAAGALSAMAHEALVENMRDYLYSQGFDESTEEKKREFDALMNLGSTLLGAAVGALADGTQGAATGATTALNADVYNRQLHPDAVHFLGDEERVKRYMAYMEKQGVTLKDETEAQAWLDRYGAAMVDEHWAAIHGRDSATEAFIRTEAFNADWNSGGNLYQGMFAVTDEKFRDEIGNLRSLFDAFRSDARIGEYLANNHFPVMVNNDLKATRLDFLSQYRIGQTQGFLAASDTGIWEDVKTMAYNLTWGSFVYTWNTLGSNEVGPYDDKLMARYYQQLLEIQHRGYEAGYLSEYDWATQQRLMVEMMGVGAAVGSVATVGGKITTPKAGGQAGREPLAGPTKSWADYLQKEKEIIAAAKGAASTGKLIGSIDGLTAAEQSFVREMVAGGKTVEIIPTATGRTADFFIDGTRVELKTMSNVVNQTSDGLSSALSSTITDARGQSGNIIIDARGQAGMTAEIAARGISRAFGADKSGKIQSITVITPQGTLYVPRIP
jgi:hypothetical protein